MSETVLIYVDGEPVTVPAQVPDKWTVFQHLRVPKGHTVRFEDSEAELDFADGWAFKAGQRFEIVDPEMEEAIEHGLEVITELEKQLEALRDEHQPWQIDPEAWKGGEA